MENNSKNQEKKISHIHSGISGFNANIITEDIARIDNLVTDYEGAILAKLKDDYDNTTKVSDKIADKIATFGGSWHFIIILASTLLLWLIWNSVFFLPHLMKNPLYY